MTRKQFILTLIYCKRKGTYLRQLLLAMEFVAHHNREHAAQSERICGKAFVPAGKT